VGKKKHVLVVDHSGGVREVLQSMLESADYRVTVAAAGKSMRDFLDVGEAVDLVILDASVPGDLGISLASHLKGLRMPMVMVSGNPPMMEFAIKNRLQLLEKPFRKDALIAAVEKAFSSGEFGQRDDA